MPSADEVIQRARQLTEMAFDELTHISGVNSTFAHDVLDAWYERELLEATHAGVDYFRRQAAFQLLLGLTCLPGAAPPPVDLLEMEAEQVEVEHVDDVRVETEPVVDPDATPPVGIPRTEVPNADKLSRRERRRRG
jgi:hypothetical protein